MRKILFILSIILFLYNTANSQRTGRRNPAKEDSTKIHDEFVSQRYGIGVSIEMDSANSRRSWMEDSINLRKARRAWMFSKMDSTKTPDELKFKPPNAIPGCIYIYYNGDTNKPYPIVVFNFFDNIDSIFEGAMFLYQIDVTENELKTVKGIIEKQTLSSDIINSLIGIRTIVDGKDNWQLMKSKLRVEALFKELAESFKDKFQYNGVVSCLEYLFDRLPNR